MTVPDHDRRDPDLVDNLVRSLLSPLSHPLSASQYLFNPISLSVTLVSRLMLNLQRAGTGSSANTEDETDSTAVGGLEFAQMVRPVSEEEHEPCEV